MTPLTNHRLLLAALALLLTLVAGENWTCDQCRDVLAPFTFDDRDDFHFVFSDLIPSLCLAHKTNWDQCCQKGPGVEWCARMVWSFGQVQTNIAGLYKTKPALYSCIRLGRCRDPHG